MKTNNKKKVVVSVLALAMGAGLAGSISGSVAWYQYSTRTTAQLQGVSAGTTRNLQIRIGSEANKADATLGWKQDLSVTDIRDYVNSFLTGTGDKPTETKLKPATVKTTGLAKDAALATRTVSETTVPAFSGHPVYQYNELPAVNSAFNQTTAAADSTFNYIQIPLQFKLEDNGTKVAKDVYIVDAKFGDTNTSDSVDVTPAIRAHFSSSANVNALLASTAESTVVSGALDLNNNTYKDRYGFTGSDQETTEDGLKFVNYGKDSTGTNQSKTNVADITGENADKQLSYKVAEGANQLLADDTNAFDFDEGVSLGQTSTDENFLTVTLTVWLEGWTELGGSNIWSKDYSGLTFDLGLRFACEADQ